MDAQKLYDCFKSDNQRRLLSILRRYPVRITDLSNITGFSTPYVRELIREFVHAKIVFRYKEKGRKMVIYMSPHLNRELTANYNYKLSNGKEAVLGISKLRGKKNRMTNFIAKVFQLFEFEDPPFKESKDYIYIQRHPEVLKGHAHMVKYNPNRTRGMIEEFNRRKEAREKNLPFFS